MCSNEVEVIAVNDYPTSRFLFWEVLIIKMPAIDYLIVPFGQKVIVYRVSPNYIHSPSFSNSWILPLSGVEKIASDGYAAMMAGKDEPLPDWWPEHIPDPKKNKKKKPNSDKNAPGSPEVPIIPPRGPEIEPPRPYQLSSVKVYKQ